MRVPEDRRWSILEGQTPVHAEIAQGRRRINHELEDRAAVVKSTASEQSSQ
jgi:hypothetical protein